MLVLNVILKKDAIPMIGKILPSSIIGNKCITVMRDKLINSIVLEIGYSHPTPMNKCSEFVPMNIDEQEACASHSTSSDNAGKYVLKFPTG